MLRSCDQLHAREPEDNLRGHGCPAPTLLRRAPRWVVYWSAQLSGWGAYFGLSVVAAHIDGQYTPRMWDVLLPELFGIAVSHALRAVIIRRRWLEQGVGHVLPRIALAALVLAVPAFLIESVLVTLVLQDASPILDRTSLDLLGRMLNWTVLLVAWSMLYFAYGYFIRHRREEIGNLRFETANRENQLSTLPRR
ncbi:MAG: hypothetical protein IPJ85_11970 [Flavobacteriales bacterium]|nr:hypothetical protein [Flavobacteriales bacterium]